MLFILTEMKYVLCNVTIFPFQLFVLDELLTGFHLKKKHFNSEDSEQTVTNRSSHNDIFYENIFLSASK